MKPIIIGLTGLAGVGKSVVANYFEDKFAFERVVLGDILREKMSDENGSGTAGDERQLQVKIRDDFGMAAFAKLSAGRIDNAIESGRSVVIESVCSWAERVFIENEWPKISTHWISVHSPMYIRTERLLLRPGRPLSESETRIRDMLELEKLDKGPTIALSDYHIVNDGSINILRNQARDILNRIIEY